MYLMQALLRDASTGVMPTPQGWGARINATDKLVSCWTCQKWHSQSSWSRMSVQFAPNTVCRAELSTLSCCACCVCSEHSAMHGSACATLLMCFLRHVVLANMFASDQVACTTLPPCIVNTAAHIFLHNTEPYYGQYHTVAPQMLSTQQLKPALAAGAHSSTFGCSNRTSGGHQSAVIP